MTSEQLDKAKTKLSSAMYKLINNGKQFYAHFILNCRVVYTDKQQHCPTMGVGVTKNSVMFMVNTEFLDKLTMEETCAVVEHEVMHIMFEHIYEGSFKRAETRDDHYLNNVAMDVAINQWIEGIPEGAVTLEMFRKQVNPNALEKQHWQYYLGLLQEKREELLKSGKLGTLDDHGIEHPDVCKDPSSAQSDLNKRIVANTAQQALKQAKGVAPDHILKQIAEMSQSSVISWKQVLSNFVARCTASTTLASRKIRNRRFGIEHPGKKKKRELVLGVCADSSGSVSDELFALFLNEIDYIAKNVKTIHYFDADAEVAGTYTIKKNSKTKKERLGNGGTAYGPAIEAAKAKGCDAIIYFGDGDCADVPTDPRVPFLWCLPKGVNPPAKFGSVVEIV